MILQRCCRIYNSPPSPLQTQGYALPRFFSGLLSPVTPSGDKNVNKNSLL